MGHEPVAVGDQVNDIIIQQVGFDGRNAEAGYFLYLIQCLGKFKKILRFLFSAAALYYQNRPGSRR